MTLYGGDTHEASSPSTVGVSRQQIESLIGEARLGSGVALGQLLEACRHYLTDQARRQVVPGLKCKVSASDLVQETSLDAHRDFASFRGQCLEELIAWLRRILLYNAANAARRYRAGKRQLSRELAIEGHPDVAKQLTAADPSPRSLAVADEEQASVLQAIERLPDDYQTVIWLRNREHYSFVEIGDFMDRSPDAVRKLWFRAIERLQSELSSDVSDER
jgi:RNA polymerase sigma-70 factor (ECF subfamily)